MALQTFIRKVIKFLTGTRHKFILQLLLKLSFAKEFRNKFDQNMETLYHQTNKLVQETQLLFSQLEKRSPNLDLKEIENAIEFKISLINSNCERLDVLCLKGSISPISPFKRQNAKMRVDQLKYDSRHLNAALNSWRNQLIRKQQEEAEREALLSQTFTANDHIDIMIDQNTQHNYSLRNAVNGVDDLISHGTGILDSLRSQRITLKGAHKRLIDIGNTLGLSNTTMRLIEHRARQDGFILVGGMLFTCIVIILVIIYLT
uniref:Golgi SNAP receptor complex member 2 isoform X1 n=2 Tax=Vespula vulgaris TaxID=7454 RepID=UPI00213A72B7|nr:Golgi SNAP receptor complex member 2 isoform X1 [Vespula vulgaris]